MYQSRGNALLAQCLTADAHGNLAKYARKLKYFPGWEREEGCLSRCAGGAET